MFHFPRLSTYNYVFIACSDISYICGSPIRTPASQCLFATTRRFSQLTASFIDGYRLGIHRMPLFDYLKL